MQWNNTIGMMNFIYVDLGDLKSERQSTGTFKGYNLG
jgi:hypothetical protein